MIAPISEYIKSVWYIDCMSRRLANRQIYPLRDEQGRTKCHIGNSAIVFEVMCEGKRMAMRVYVKPHRNLQAIYGENYYPRELLVNAMSDNLGMADVVLCEWYEGVTLQSKIEELYLKPAKMALLSRLFEEFSLSLLNERWAHGDIKPENIIFENGTLRLIDFDALYREGFTADDCAELGTRHFQHPQRSRSNFDKRIDDYPIALIITVLASLVYEPKLGATIKHNDYLLIQPALAVAGQDAMLDHIERLFAERGDVRHYRIARLLRSPQPALPQLKNTIEAKPQGATSAEALSLEYSNGYWGFAENGRYVIPPLYDLAFEFSEGLALVRVGDVWHFINHLGEVVITCGRGVGIKPMHDGKTHISREDGEFDIYSDGRVEKV